VTIVAITSTLLRTFTHALSLSYIHLAQGRTLFIMVTSDAHESVAATIRDQLHVAMLEQQTLNPPLASWQLHANRSVWYSDDADEQCTADMTPFFEQAALLHLEVLHPKLGHPSSQNRSNAPRRQ
jgi:hypothetical protein